MKSRYSNLVMLVAAVCAFAPVMVVDYALDNYVRAKETTELQTEVENAANRMQDSIDDSVNSLRRILMDSPSLCTPTFVANARATMESSISLRQVVVENKDGAQFCDAFDHQVSYARLSGDLTLPGRSETLSVVKLSGLSVPAMRVSQTFGNTRIVSAIAPLMAQSLDNFGHRIDPTAVLRVSLTNGTDIGSVGDTNILDDANLVKDYIFVEVFADDIPLRIDAAIPFSVVRAKYSDLDLAFTIIACIMSASLLVLSLQYVRRSQLPAFDLERAIANGELKPYYQPVINLTTGRMYGCEVLCRWEKPNGQLVPPGVFIDYAEVTGLAIPMTLSLMHQVKSDLSELCRDMPDLKVSINLFEGHFRDSTFVDDVQTIFGNSDINFRQLVFEITERRELANSTATNAVISGLHALGSKLAMDDAGTGHSNLAYMQTLGVDIIKIDRVFVDMIKDDTSHVPVLDGLIAMARDLGTDVVAEGVETETQALYLRARGVVLAQGFLFAPAIKPKPFVELARALNGSKKVHPSVRAGQTHAA